MDLKWVFFVISLFAAVFATDIPKYYPFHIELESGHDPTTAKHVCSGTIIDSGFILTAAKCVQLADIKLGRVYAKAGINDAASRRGDHQVRVQVIKAYIHPLFDDRLTSQYNIAVLKLKRHLAFNRYVQSIDLLSEDHIPTGTAVSIGWAIPRNLDRGNYAPTTADFHTITGNRECLYNYDRITKNHLCLNVRNPTCTKDSGGPIAQMIENKAYLIGIHLARGFDCEEPEVGLRVSALRSFIFPIVNRPLPLDELLRTKNQESYPVTSHKNVW